MLFNKNKKLEIRNWKLGPLILISIFHFLISSVPLPAAIAHTAHGGSTGGTHNATSIAVTVTAAINETVVVYCAETSTGACTSVTDNASPVNTYVAGPSQSTNVLTKVFYSLNIAHAPTTDTVLNKRSKSIIQRVTGGAT